MSYVYLGDFEIDGKETFGVSILSDKCYERVKSKIDGNYVDTEMIPGKLLYESSTKESASDTYDLLKRKFNDSGVNFWGNGMRQGDYVFYEMDIEPLDRNEIPRIVELVREVVNK
jgi:hypothetical protein